MTHCTQSACLTAAFKEIHKVFDGDCDNEDNDKTEDDNGDGKNQYKIDNRIPKGRRLLQVQGIGCALRIKLQPLFQILHIVKLTTLLQ